MRGNPFKKGDTVRIRPGWKKKGSRTGIVSNEHRRSMLVSIIWAGTKTPATYHIDLIERVDQQDRK